MSCKRLHIDEVLDSADAAKRAGVELKTWSSYVSRGFAPLPADRVGVAPVWTREQIDDWKRERPGQGVGGGRPPKAKRKRASR